MNTENTLPKVPLQGHSIAITIAPRPSDPCPTKQLQSHLPILRKLKHCSKQFTLSAELTLNGVLHYHGTLLITNKIYWFRHLLPLIKEKLGFVLIKPSPNQAWTDYCNKDIGDMKEILEINLPITEDHPILEKIKRFKKKVPDIIQSPKKGNIIDQMYGSPRSGSRAKAERKPDDPDRCNSLKKGVSFQLAQPVETEVPTGPALPHVLAT